MVERERIREEEQEEEGDRGEGGAENEGGDGEEILSFSLCLSSPSVVSILSI